MIDVCTFQIRRSIFENGKRKIETVSTKFYCFDQNSVRPQNLRKIFHEFMA